MRDLETRLERWPIAGSFVISRGAKQAADVIVTTIRDGACAGWSECVPYPRYGESLESVQTAINSVAEAVATGATREEIAARLGPGAALNAVDCALWDLEAKITGQTVATLAGCLSEPLTTAFTMSLASAAGMAEAARRARKFPLIKLKLGGDGDEERMRAVRDARPDARIIVDANEAWQASQLDAYLAVAADVAIEVVEQPLPVDHDAVLADIPHPVPVCADESVHHAGDIAALATRYDAVNIKLDKAGGLTGALKMAAAARGAGMKTMVGCMVGTSLAMAPAFLVAQGADWVDLDGPLLLAGDRDPGLRYDGATLYPPSPAFWG